MRDALKAAWNGIGNSLGGLASGSRDLTSRLVPLFLQNVFWLIDTKFFTLAKKGYGQNSIVFACLRVLSQAVPEPPLIVFKKTMSGEHEKLATLDQSGLRALIENPNELLSEYQFWQLVALQTGIAGRSHWFKERDMLGRPIALWPLRPDRVGPIYAPPDENRSGQRVLWGWSYQVPGEGRYIPVERRDVMTFLFPDPAGESGGMAEGIGPMQALAAEIGSDNAATHYVGAIMANAATPNLVIKVVGKVRDADTAKRLKDQFIREFGGDNLGRPGVLDADASIQRIAFSMRDLTFPDLRAVAESRIAAGFGIPAIMVGLKVGLDSGIRATIAEQREYFAETTLTNLWRQWSDQWNKDITSEFDSSLICRFDHTKVRALSIQTKNEKQPLENAFKLGAITANEYRVKVLDLPETLEGNVYYVPNGVTVVVASNLDKEKPPAALPLPGRPQGDFGSAGPPAINAPPTPAALPAPTTPALNTAGAAVAAAKRAAITGSANGSGTHDRKAQRARHPTASRVLRTAFINRFTPKLSAFLSKLGRRVVARFHEANVGSVKAHGIGTVMTGEDQTELSVLMEEQAMGVYRATYSAELSPHIEHAIREGIAGRVTGIDDTTRSVVAEIVNQGNADGLGIQAIADLLAAAPEFSPERAALIAQTETTILFNQAAMASARDSNGDIVGFDVEDGDGCPECADADGSFWTIDEADGNEIEHPGCVRVLVPRFASDGEATGDGGANG